MPTTKSFTYAERTVVEALAMYMDGVDKREWCLQGFASFMRGYLGAAGLHDAAIAFRALSVRAESIARDGPV